MGGLCPLFIYQYLSLPFGLNHKDRPSLLCHISGFVKAPDGSACVVALSTPLSFDKARLVEVCSTSIENLACLVLENILLR